MVLTLNWEVERWIMKKIAGIGFFTAMFTLSLSAYAQQVPSYSELTQYLVDVKGWKAEEAAGVDIRGPYSSMVHAMRGYAKGNMTVDAQIIVGDVAQGSWEPFASGYAVDTPDILVKTVELSGYQVGINHEKKENLGMIVVLLHTSDISGIFTLNYSGMSFENALDFAKKFPWKSMEDAIE